MVRTYINFMPKVSVLIPVFNNAPYLKAAIDSILVQTFDDFELLVIDDGSSDQSLELLNGGYPQRAH